jgi:hypothetical protein
MFDLSRQLQVEEVDELHKKALENFQKALELATTANSSRALLEGFRTLLARMEVYKEDGNDVSMPHVSPRQNPTRKVDPQIRSFVRKKRARVQKELHHENATSGVRLTPPPKLLPLSPDKIGMISFILRQF